jgi:hypothetical protein
MLCSLCFGRRVINGNSCVECGGQGEIHCCDGLQAQPLRSQSPRHDGIRETEKGVRCET